MKSKSSSLLNDQWQPTYANNGNIRSFVNFHIQSPKQISENQIQFTPGQANLCVGFG